jgi:biotin operon repressor
VARRTFTAEHRARAAELMTAYQARLTPEQRHANAVRCARATAASLGYELYTPRVLAALEEGAIYVPDLAEDLQLTRTQVRGAIDRLRKAGLDVRCLRHGSQVFALAQE